MNIALVGSELEENLGLRYMASSLEARGHKILIVPFNSEHDTPHVVQQVTASNPEITGLSMVYTGRAREFCRLATALREAAYRGHVIAGGHFASLNCQRLLQDFPAFDSVGLGEGEGLLCALAEHLNSVQEVQGLCYRASDGTIVTNPSAGSPDNLDELPFPKRTTFHDYFDKPIGSILTSRGCWRDCAFCSINAWYKNCGGKKFRVRSVENIVTEMKGLFYDHGIRIFNFQDDNFFLPDQDKAVRRFEALRDALFREGIKEIAIAVKARPDSITRESIQVLDELNLFRVFLGVENASERGLRNLNRKCTVDKVLNALDVLNDFDVHIAYNFLMFEPDTVMDDILINLRFMERHIENPFNFCRAEAYAGTGLEAKLRAEGRLLGDYFGFDYRLKDPASEAFHQIANHAFFDRNFSDFGLHYFNMQVDFYFQLLRRFHPELLTEKLRGAVRSFIKRTNLDTHECLCEIYDFVKSVDPKEHVVVQGFARRMRQQVDARSAELQVYGQRTLDWVTDTYERRGQLSGVSQAISGDLALPFLSCQPAPYRGPDSLRSLEFASPDAGWRVQDPFGAVDAPIPYTEFKKRLAAQGEGR